MSEYQFYEFMAIDRPLTEKERKEVSSFSSRTEASMYGASFVYHYDGSPGDEYRILAKYFDAMLYIANWGSTRLLFRFPASAVDIEQLNLYEYDRSVVVDRQGDFVILDLNYDEEDGGSWGWVEGDGLLSTMVGLRQNIMNGDMRALYLLWLKAVSTEIGYDIISTEDIQAPPVPHNLKQSSRELRAFIDFFNIELELVRAAASFSADYAVPKLDIKQGLSRLSDEEKETFLRKLAEGVPNLHQELVKRLRELLADNASKPESSIPSVTTILQRVDEATQAIEQEEVAKLNAYLDDLASRESKLWNEIYFLISQKRVKPYEEAIKHLVELEKLAERDETMADFNAKIQDIYKQYPTLRGLHSRMSYKGFKKN